MSLPMIPERIKGLPVSRTLRQVNLLALTASYDGHWTLLSPHLPLYNLQSWPFEASPLVAHLQPARLVICVRVPVCVCVRVRLCVRLCVRVPLCLCVCLCVRLCV